MMGAADRERRVLARIDALHRHCEPELRALKYAALAESPFRFFRGTAHLQWEDWRDTPPDFDPGPAAWCCGDLHVENFGTFRGENRLTYFDVNDFDEAALGPSLADPARCAVSIWLAADLLALAASDAAALVTAFLDAYVHTLRVGHPGWIERATARGVVKELLQHARDRTRADLLDARTSGSGVRRRLTTDGTHAVPCGRGERDMVIKALQAAAIASTLRAVAEAERAPDFFEVLDVARRIAGTGSLGERRFVVLVRGRGGAAGQFLLDAKAVRESAFVVASRVTQPAWVSEAQRVTTTQRRMQAAAPALLTPIRIGDRASVLRELQPREDRLRLDRSRKHPRRLHRALETMGTVAAWAQLRASGRSGGATADALAASVGTLKVRDAVLKWSRAYARQVHRDWRSFADAVAPPAPAAG